MADDFNVTLNLRGMKELVRAMHVLGDKVAQKKAGEEDLLAAAAPIIEAAKRDAPRDPGGRPGFGAETIHAVAEETRNEREVARVALGPGPRGWHLKFSELGTSSQPAQPWLRPAVDTRLNDALTILAARIGARIRDAWAKAAPRG